MNQTLARSINTSLVAIMPILAVLVLGAADPRRDDAAVLRSRAARRPDDRGVLLDLHRLAARRGDERARAPLPPAPRAPRSARCRPGAAQPAAVASGAFAESVAPTRRPRAQRATAARADRTDPSTAPRRRSRGAGRTKRRPHRDLEPDPTAACSRRPPPAKGGPALIDVRAARARPDGLRAALARKGAAELFDEFLEVDRLAARRPRRSRTLRAATRPKGQPTAEASAPSSRRRRRSSAQPRRRLIDARAPARRAARADPEPARRRRPDGTTDEDAVELRRVGEPPRVRLPRPRDHLELGGFDIERGARLSGARFAYRMGRRALVELALYRYALDRLVGRGFVPVLPPVLVREEAMFGTGFLPTEEANLYRVEPDGLYLTGTSEVALAGLHARGDPGRRRAAAALRRLLDVLPPRGGRGRARHAGHLPRPPVRQGRDVRLHDAGGLGRGARGAARRSRRRSSTASASPTGSSTSRRATSARRRRRSTTSRRGSRPRSATGRSRRARTRPTTRRAALASATATTRS